MRQVIENGSLVRWWQPQDLLRSATPRASLPILAAWAVACGVSIAAAQLTIGWAAIPVRVGPLVADVSIYPPLTLCVLLTLWIGPWWGIVPAYLSSFALSLHHGMPPLTGAVFSLATPIALTVLWSLMVMLEVSPALPSVRDLARFAVLSLVATGASSVGALVWDYHHGFSFPQALAVWRGWVLGDFLQIVLIVGPLLFFLDRPARRWLAAHLAPEPRSGLGNRFFVGVFTLVLFVMIAIGATAARLFLSSLSATPDTHQVSFGTLRTTLWEAAVFLSIYALVFVASVVVFSSTLGTRIEWHLRDISERQRIQEERERLIAELQQALADVRVLGGLVPICAHCKRIRDDTGYWNQIEGYLRERSALQFSHGICPDCRRTRYPEYPAS
jgi:diguanylate cyclase